MEHSGKFAESDFLCDPGLRFERDNPLMTTKGIITAIEQCSTALEQAGPHICFKLKFDKLYPNGVSATYHYDILVKNLLEFLIEFLEQKTPK